MQFSILAILALGVSATVATTANIFTNTYCGDDDYINNINLSKDCHPLSGNVMAFDVRNIDSGCTGESTCHRRQFPRRRGTYEAHR